MHCLFIILVVGDATDQRGTDDDGIGDARDGLGRGAVLDADRKSVV